MIVKIYGHNHGYDFRNIVSVFLPVDQFQIVEENQLSGTEAVMVGCCPLLAIESRLIHTQTEATVETKLLSEDQVLLTYRETIAVISDKVLLKRNIKRRLVRQLYEALRTQLEPLSKWGVLVGVRPTKLCHEMMDQGLSDVQIAESLRDDYYVEEDKIQLLLEICHLERPYIYPIDESRFSIYLSIPFCPTRCLYCSFPSYAAKGREAQIEAYTMTLIEEIKGNCEAMRGKKVDTVYFGGGTPAVLTPNQIEKIVEALRAHYDLSGLREFTFEAGRPDAINDDLLKTLKALGIDRVCVNPQTMDDRTLHIIGRKHNVEQTVKAMGLVKHHAFHAVNMDLIVGLPEETLSDVRRSIESVLALKPENITVHTLAIKRSSRLNRERGDYELPSEHLVADMLKTIDKIARAQGYVPYYMYRQKYMLGNLENVGYTLPGKASVYNMLMMEEKQTILAFGAGATSKLFYPAEDRFERIHNVKSLEDYFGRIDEMISKKNIHLALAP